MTTYPQISTMHPHILHYGVCQNETFQFTDIQNANTAIENSLYSRRRSSTWPSNMLEKEESLETNSGMQEEVLVAKPEIKMETEGYLDESPLPESVISPERSPSIETNDLPQQNQNVQVTSTQCSHKTKNKNVWGDMSYADLITKAILSSQHQRMTLAEIYAWIVDNVIYFADKKDTSSTSGWKNSIRHNLSLHNKFKRVPNDTSGKSSWWTINPEKTGTKTRRVTNMSPSPRPSTPKLGRKDSGKETPTMKRKERKKGRCRRGSEGAINLAKLDFVSSSPLMALTRTNSSDACSGDSQASTPMTSPIMKQRSGSFSGMMSPHSPRVGTPLATATTWNSMTSDVQILYSSSPSPKSRIRSYSHPAGESTLIHTISPSVRKSSESRPNCALSAGIPSPESISDTSQGCGTPQGPWTSPITSPPAATTHSAKFQLSNQRVRSSSLTINRTPGLVGITEAVKPNLYRPQIAARARAFSYTTAPPSQHYEHYSPQTEITNAFLPPTYADVQYKRLLHTVSDPYANTPNCNNGVHITQQPLSAGVPYMIPPQEFSFDYEEVEPKMLDTLHPRVQDIKRESIGEMPPNAPAPCFHINMQQNQVFFTQNFQHNPASHSVDEKPFKYLNSSCQHAQDAIPAHQIDLKNLQPTLFSDPVSLNSLERDENFEMLDHPWRLLQSTPQ